MVYMCDQEPAIGAVIRAAVDQLRIQSTWVGAVKENSAVGESQSNGKAEAAIKCVEDQQTVRVPLQNVSQRTFFCSKRAFC